MAREHTPDYKEQNCPLNTSKKSVRVAFTGVLIALSFVLARLEALIPPFTGIPGVKPGLANITTMASAYLLGWPYAVCVSLFRIILSGFTFNGLFSMLYSLAGGFLSLIVMLLLKRSGKLSLITISMLSGVAHNIGQTFVALIVLGRAALYYLPLLLVSGCVAGCITGLLCALLLKSLNKKRLFG